MYGRTVAVKWHSADHLTFPSETVVILIAGLMCMAVILKFHDLSMRLSLVIE